MSRSCDVHCNLFGCDHDGSVRKRGSICEESDKPNRGENHGTEGKIGRAKTGKTGKTGGRKTGENRGQYTQFEFLRAIGTLPNFSNRTSGGRVECPITSPREATAGATFRHRLRPHRLSQFPGMEHSLHPLSEDRAFFRNCGQYPPQYEFSDAASCGKFARHAAVCRLKDTSLGNGKIPVTKCRQEFYSFFQQLT